MLTKTISQIQQKQKTQLFNILKVQMTSVGITNATHMDYMDWVCGKANEEIGKAVEQHVLNCIASDAVPTNLDVVQGFLDGVDSEDLPTRENIAAMGVLLGLTISKRKTQANMLIELEEALKVAKGA